MHSITCVVQAFDAPSDTCSVELSGIGIIDAWLDGVAIAPTVDRSYIVGGAIGVVSMPDINRPCDATLIQVTPPGSPDVYDPDQIVVYTGSLLIPTDNTGAGCANVTFPQPYSTVPIVAASAAHPASVTISNITETGFIACVTGGKVSSKHSVSYSTKSSRTTTAVKNKAPTIDHNEADVATHYVIDFKDGDVVWTVTDHASGPARAQIEATLSDDFKATLGGGGSPAVIFSAQTALPVDVPPWDGMTYQLPSWDTVLIDKGNWVAEGSTGPDIKVPSDGTYLLAYTAKFVAHSGDVSHLPTPTLDTPKGPRVGVAKNLTLLTELGTQATLIPGGFDTGTAGPPASYPVPTVGDAVRIIPLTLSKDDDLQLWLSNPDDTNSYRCYAASIMLMKIGASGAGEDLTSGVLTNDQSITLAAGVQNFIPWDGVFQDTTSGKTWSNVHPTRFVAPADGTYEIRCAISFYWNTQPSTDGGVDLGLVATGLTEHPAAFIIGIDDVWAHHTFDAADPTQLEICRKVRLPKGAYVEAYIECDQGGAIGINQSALLGTFDPLRPPSNYFPRDSGIWFSRVS